MGIFANNNKQNAKQNTIWARYMKLIVPSVIVLIILMDIIIYAVVASKSKENISESSYKTVELQCRNIEQIFKRYEADLHIMGKEYRDNPKEFMAYAEDFIRGHVNEYSYVRLTLQSGESFTTIAGKDPNDAKYRKLYKQIIVEGKSISINNAHPTDVCDGDVFSISIPIKGKNGAAKAVVTAVFPADVIDRHLIPAEEGKSEFMAVVDDNFVLRLYHGAPKSANIEKLVEKGFAGLDKTIYNGAKEMEKGQKRGSGTYKTPDGWTMVCHYSQIGDMKWFITLNVPLMVLNMDILVTSIVLLITGILTIMIVLLVIKNITNKVIMTPLQAINRFSNDLAEGKLYSTETRNITSKDELGTVRDNIEKMQHKLQTVVTDIRRSTDEVSQNTSLIRDTVLKISEDALVQSACVDDISSAIDNMNTYIMQNAERASTTKNNSEEIEQDIDIITMASDNTLESIQNVIGKIKVINEISTRTDLLAINAAVEAARAGENGKGFAVVAAEIRKLAEHCQKASKEINELSEESLYITQQSAEFIQNTIPKIKENAESISEISDNCNNQLNMTENISRAILQLVDITSHNSQSSDDMQISTQVLYKNMKELNESMDFFKLTTEKNKHRENIMSEIQNHTSEILKLKAKLVTVAESMQDSQEVDKEIDRVIALANEATKKDDNPTVSNDEEEKSDDKSDEFFNSVDDFLASNDQEDKATPTARPTFNSKPDKDLDRGFESF